jgi:predicted Zn-dependent protease
MRVAVVPEALSLKAVKRRENDYGHPQYLISDLFHMLNTDKAVVRFREQYCILGVTLEDIYPGEEWNYVFGQARPLERVGVFSFARHCPVFYDGVHAADAELDTATRCGWIRRCQRTMCHEVAHMLNLRHCITYRCLMNGCNGPQDSAGASFLCGECLRKVLYALASLAPPEEAVDERYARMGAALESLDPSGASSMMQKDAAWLAARRARLQRPSSAAAENAGALRNLGH